MVVRLEAVVLPLALALLSGCTSGAPEPALVHSVPEAATDGTQAGWDAWRLGRLAVRTYFEPDEEGTPGLSVDEDGWPYRDEPQAWMPGMATLVAADGREIPLAPPPGTSGTGLLYAADSILEPGEYQLQVEASGLQVHVSGLRVGDYGQVHDFDRNAPDGRVYRLDLRDSTSGIARILRMTPLHVRLSEPEPGREQLTVWAEGTNDDHAALCRAWQGDARLDGSGLATAVRDQIDSEVGATFTDVSLRFGLNETGTELGGVELLATLDTRPLDYLDQIDRVDGSEPDEGAFCEALSYFEESCVPCADTGAPFCYDFRALRGLGHAQPEAELLARLPHLDALDDAAPCSGPDDFGDIFVWQLGR